MKVIKTFVILLTLWLLVIQGFAQQSIIINSNDRVLIGKHTEYFVDTNNTLRITDVLQQPFTKGKAEILNLGNIPHNVWIRFSVRSQTENELYLEIMAPLLERLELYEIIDGTPKMLFTGGIVKPFNARSIISENWLFNLNITSEVPHTFYIKGITFFPFQIPIAVSSKNKYTEYNQRHNLFWGLYIGITFFAFIYNFFIFLSLRERRYLYYILYILGSVIFYLGLQGFAFQFLWPNKPYFNYILPVFISFTNIIIALFAMNFLEITRKQKVQYFFFIGIIAAFSMIIAINFAGAYTIAVVTAQLMSMVVCLYFIYAGFSSFRRGVPGAKFFLIAWTLFLALVFIYLLTINNIIPSNYFTTHCIFIGHMTEVGLLSFALADRINWLKSENDRRQKEIIYQLKINEEIQLEANRMLEQKIVERTAEVIEQKNEAVKQRKRSDELLLNILPEETAEELKITGTAKTRYFEQVTVLFTDMKDFTQASETLSPDGLIAEINYCFCAFDRIMEINGVEKIKTIGDAYMAAGGLPLPNKTHAKDVVNAAMSILQFMQGLKEKRKAEGRDFFEIRIGIHTGPVVAGIVGVKKFAYDIWGDTVNIANRMESSGEAGKINISATTYEIIKDEYLCTYRGKQEAKHKGMIDMYFVQPNFQEIPSDLQVSK